VAYETPATEIDLVFADGEYTFALRLPQLAELQSKRGAGVFAIYARVRKGRYAAEGVEFGLPGQGEAFAEDLYETIRLGLIGGGKGVVDEQPVKVDAVTAKRLLDNYVIPAPLTEAWNLAAAILGAKIVGFTPPKAEPAVAPVPAESEQTVSS
jgi:hypothetical protein